MIKITDINDERISLYKSLRFTPKEHSDQNVFVAEGEKVVQKLLQSNIEIVSIFALPEFYSSLSELIINQKLSDTILYTADSELMNQIVGYKLHSGIMAIAKQPAMTLPEKMSSPIIILNNIINSENVGAIVRNAAAFNINSIIFDNQTSSPYLRRAVRVSMGTIFNMKYYQSHNIAETIIDLKNSGYTIISVEITNNSIPINDYIFENKIALIFGSESSGIEKSVLDLSDDIIYIPINPDVPSINVAACSAVIFNEISYHKK
jgi:tRNA G18 (ribose-2'-O)-methylase SpoU